ncbi:MAG TPA: glycosyltransferase family 4 protein [Longilinea sp.]|nr:glycosyltransferase family 4 protein [Longilinea sp.]
MHILLIHQAFAALDEAGGTRHIEMARLLVQKGHQVTIISSPISYLTGKTRLDRIRWVDKDHPEPGITILRTYTYPALHRSFFHRVLSFLSFMVSSFVVGLGVANVSLVWGTSPPIFQGLTAWMLARLKRKPFLFEVRDLWPAFAIGMGVLRNPILIRLSQGLERFLYRHADRVMVNSPGFIDHVTARGARWVELIPNGADPAMFDPQGRGDQFRKEHNLNNHFVAMYAGAHGLSNDLGVVLDAAEELIDQQAIKFVLVGDGKEKKPLQAQAAARHLENLVFVPPVPKSRMAEVLAASDACIAILKPLDLYKTTYPNKVFDYMAASRPVVLAIDGVIRDVVEEAGAGIVVPPGDAHALAKAVRDLAADRKRSSEIGEAGRRCIEDKFNRNAMAGKLVLLLEEMGRIHGG